MHQPNVMISFVLYTCVLSANANAQQPTPQENQKCEHVLSNMGARLAIPSLTSPAVREAVCNCVKADATFSEVDVSEKTAAESTQSVVAQCISRAVPAEKMAALPDAIILNLQQSINRRHASSSFVNAKTNFDTCQQPEYPTPSLRVQASGDTLLAFKIGASGKVLDGVVIRSAGLSAAHKLLDVTALFALMQCNFEPAHSRNKAIETWAEVEYRWRIN